MTTIKEQTFGVEIELTGITREKASQLIADYFHTTSRYVGQGYAKYIATDRQNRKWSCMSDGSIITTRKVGNRTVSANRDYSCEVVTPILNYSDLNDLQEIVRILRENGAVANNSTGIHVHVGADQHTPESLTRLMMFAIGRQDLFYEALQIGDREFRWCKKMNADLMNAMRNAVKGGNVTMDDLKSIWYSSINDGYSGGLRIWNEHYNNTRYHGINLHSFFTGKGIEFRLFNGTTHAGKIKSYVQFCLAMNTWSINCEKDSLFFKKTTSLTKEQKRKLMNNMLKNRLGMRGPEFKTARMFLTEAFKDVVEIAA